MNKVRCPNCRGMKQVAKLGGMMGDCNLCLGVGSIKAEHKPKAVILEPIESATDIITQVANVGHDIEQQIVAEEPQIKVDPKRTVYRKKKAEA